MKTFYFLVSLAAFTYGETQNGGNEKELGYIFTYPRSMTTGHVVRGCLTLYNATLPAELNLRFVKHECFEPFCGNSYKITKEHQCVDINVPNVNESDTTSREEGLIMELTANGKKISKIGDNDITIFNKQTSLHVQTDRHKYKPGDLIKFRVLALDNDLKPFKEYMIPKIVLNDHLNNKVKEWQNVTTSHGLAHLEHQLADNAPEGMWRLLVNDWRASTFFEVKHYILPRFKTTLTHPNSLFIDDKSLEVKLCAKYSYGRNVKGTGSIKVEVRNYGFNEPAPVSKAEKLKNGCVDLKIPTEDLHLNRSMYYNIHIIGSVTEQGTDEVQTETGYMYVTSQPYSMQFNYRYSKLKNGLPYTGEINFNDKRHSIKGKSLNVCYKYQEGWYGNSTDIACKLITITDDKSSLRITIPPLKNFNKGNLQVEAKFPNETEESYYNQASIFLNPTHSASNNSISIIPVEDEKACSDKVSFDVLYTLNGVKDENIIFNYLVVSRFDVVKSGNVVVTPKRNTVNLNKFPNVIDGDNDFILKESNFDEFKIDFDLNRDLLANGKLLVYYVVNGEVIADDTEITVKRCLPNNVDVNWQKDTLEPGEPAKLNIKTGTASLCSITGVDKATTFEFTNKMSVDSILRPTEYNRYPYYYSPSHLNCVMPEIVPEETTTAASTTTDGSITPNMVMIRPRPYVHWSSSGVDASNTFQESSIGVITSAKTVTKPCQEVHHYPIAAMTHMVRRPVSTTVAMFGAPASPGAPAAENASNKESAQAGLGGGGASDPVQARTFFPETWLWDLIYTGDKSDSISFERNIPDSITNWITDVLCVSDADGVGLSEPIELNVFKPFFVDVLMPYSIKRKTEILQLPVAVFNYLNHSIPVKLTLGENEDMELVDGDDKRATNLCVEAGDSVTHVYRIRALKIGSLNISVDAALDPTSTEKCGHEKVVVKRDLVYKPIKVEPEGYPSDIVKTALLCANDTLGKDHANWEIHLPEGVVEDTIKGQITINSDILGPMIENLENLLRVPSGCGEQTMAGLVPNLYVMRYLKSNSMLTEEISKRAVKNMETGYQRILGYAHPDGSFSAFGLSDKTGSMFLTAFVVRTLRQMKEYVNVDDEVIAKAVKWIISHQMDNGCVNSVAHVFHPMGADSDKDNQTSALTSYVMISLFETNIDVPKDFVGRAVECMSRADKGDNYTMAITSYAFGLMKLDDKADENLRLLMEAGDVDGDLRYWSQGAKNLYSAANDVEVTGYGLLSLLQRGTPENIGAASSLVRWLQTKMNPQGGYVSTQDTVVALDGMSRYANIINKKEPRVDVEISTKQSGKHDVKITKRDRNVKNEIPLEAYPEVIDVKVKGDGCVLGQAAVKFHVNKKPNAEALKLTVETKPLSKSNTCNLIQLNPCVSYDSKEPTNMALLEIKMPSGYVPDEASLHSLRGSVSDVKKFELIDNRVVLYFNHVTKEKICTPFTIQQSVVVENLADPTVHLYDYYTPELSLEQSYKLPTCEANNAIDP